MKKLKDIVEFLDNRRKPLNNLERDKMKGNIPYYGANGIVDYVNEYIFDEPLILLAEDGGHFGSKIKPIAYKIEGKAWVNNHAHVLKPKKGTDIDFLKWSLSFYDVNKYTTGSTRIKLTKGDAERIELKIPDLVVQREIAQVLEQADRARQLRKAANVLTDQFLQSSFLSLFGDPVKNEKGFPVMALENVCEQIFLGLTSKVEYVESGGVPLIRATDINEGRLSFNKAKFISEAQHKKITKNRLTKKGDVLVSKSGSLGTCAIVETDIEFTTYESIITLQLKENVISNRFLVYLIRNPNFQSHIVGKKVGGTVSHLNLQMFRKIQVVVPPISLQNEFAYIVTQAELLHQKQRDSEQELEQLFQILLQEYFG
jgi:type I restriction enzyme, S subunit